MTFEDAKQIARERWGRATAFRVGYVVGESGRTVIDAYPEAGKLRSRYVEGIAWGKEQRFKRQDL